MTTGPPTAGKHQLQLNLTDIVIGGGRSVPKGKTESGFGHLAKRQSSEPSLQGKALAVGGVLDCEAAVS